MKVAYTCWTWINANNAVTGRNQLEQALKEIKSLGYDYVEFFASISSFYDDPNDLVALTKKYNINLCNLYGFFGLDVDAVITYGKKQIDFLAAIGGKWYNCSNGLFSDNGPWERPSNYEMLDKTCYIADTLGKYALERGVKLCFHPHYGTYVISQSDIDYFLAHTDPNYVFMCIDTAQTVLAGIRPLDLIRQCGSRIAYMHLKEVDTYALSKAAAGPEKMATVRALGHGTLNFPEVKATLEEIGYDGILCVELEYPEVCNYHSAEVSRTYLHDVLGL